MNIIYIHKIKVCNRIQFYKFIVSQCVLENIVLYVYSINLSPMRKRIYNKLKLPIWILFKPELSKLKKKNILEYLANHNFNMDHKFLFLSITRPYNFRKKHFSLTHT